MERIFAAVVVTALFVTSCGGSKREPTDAVRAYCGDEADEVEQRIDALIPRLTLAEKVNMLAGSLTGERLWTVPGHAESGIPDFVMIDGPRGLSQLAGPATSFPVGMARGATFDPELGERSGEVRLHRLRRHQQSRPDLAVGQTRGGQAGHVLLGRGQRRPSRSCGDRRRVRPQRQVGGRFERQRAPLGHQRDPPFGVR